jgi:hypothetical protein
MNKENFQRLLIGILLLLLIWLAWRLEVLRKDSFTQNDELKKSIIAADSLVKEADGRYAKLVNYYNSEKTLKRELQKSNGDLYKIIKKQDERILSLTTTVISLSSKLDEGFGKINPLDSNQIDLALQYPSKEDPFIKWDGTLDRKTAKYFGEWTFGKLPLQIILTEEKRGLWKYRLVGPEWLAVDSLRIESLPPDQYTPIVDRNVQFLLGGGYYTSLVNSNLGSINIGVGVNLFDQHSIILGATTNQEVGINYYYKFKSLKKRNK